ncbi:hypothetical protein [Thermaurantimonas aggregans]|uniref:hypothetical protein n=1 Tax=Thermaurantimonas aggregans TaxID=2173829 RepID=UPI0023F48156|nr:hypothetical protein [Thermaurantimonas aggregans]MCX8147848.1 hypothetical protein [Thermaurantimonas aggregans]
MKNFLNVSLMVLVCLNAFGQTTVLKKPKSVLDENYTYGKNRKHYVHTGFAYLAGVSATTLPNLEFRPLSSSVFQFFALYKYKINNTFSLTSELSFGGVELIFKFKDSIPQYSLFTTQKEDKINRGEIELRQNIRIRYSGAQSKIGNFIEIGILGGIATTNQYTHAGVTALNQKTEINFINSPVQLTDGNLYSFNRWYYGFAARLGFNRISFPFRYVNIGDVEYMVTGIEISFF